MIGEDAAPRLDKALALHLLDNLANSSLWISERVLQEARKAINTLLE